MKILGHKLKTRGKYAVMCGLVGVYASLAFLSPPVNEISTGDVVGELLVFIQPFIWLFFIDTSIRSGLPNRILTIGLMVLAVGTGHDLLDEFFELADVLSSVENIGIPFGLMSISIALSIENYRKSAYIKLIENKESHARLNSMTDALTSLGNKRYLSEYFSGVVASPYSERAAYSVVFIDIDNFKLLNDNFGHQDGDEALRNLAKIIRQNIREHDAAFRYGGEEFLIFFKDTSPEVACMVVERIKATFATVYHEQSETLHMKVSFSAGVTQLTRADSLKSAIGRVDQAMYESKRRGKDTITTVVG